MPRIESPPRSPVPQRIAAAALLLCVAAAPGRTDPGTTPAAAPTSAPVTVAAGLRPHVIVYRASFIGIGAGTLELTLRPGARPGAWTYETRPNPSFLASFAINPGSRERSSFELDSSGHVAPQRYHVDDGTTAHQDNIELAYDRARGRITGKARGTVVDLPLEPQTQDAMSIRLAVPVDLLAGREPAEYPMVDGGEIKHFLFHRAGPERIRTALGDLDTVVYTNERKGAGARDRTWRWWYVPSLGWLPVRIEQRQDGKTRLAFEVRSLKWL